MRKFFDPKFWFQGTPLWSVMALTPKALTQIFPHTHFLVALMFLYHPPVAILVEDFVFTKHHSSHRCCNNWHSVMVMVVKVLTCICADFAGWGQWLSWPFGVSLLSTVRLVGAHAQLHLQSGPDELAVSTWPHDSVWLGDLQRHHHQGQPGNRHQGRCFRSKVTCS